MHLVLMGDSTIDIHEETISSCFQSQVLLDYCVKTQLKEWKSNIRKEVTISVTNSPNENKSTFPQWH